MKFVAPLESFRITWDIALHGLTWGVPRANCTLAGLVIDVLKHYLNYLEASKGFSTYIEGFNMKPSFFATVLDCILGEIPAKPAEQTTEIPRCPGKSCDSATFRGFMRDFHERLKDGLANFIIIYNIYIIYIYSCLTYPVSVIFSFQLSQANG